MKKQLLVLMIILSTGLFFSCDNSAEPELGGITPEALLDEIMTTEYSEAKSKLKNGKGIPEGIEGTWANKEYEVTYANGKVNNGPGSPLGSYSLKGYILSQSISEGGFDLTARTTIYRHSDTLFDQVLIKTTSASNVTENKFSYVSEAFGSFDEGSVALTIDIGLDFTSKAGKVVFSSNQNSIVLYEGETYPLYEPYSETANYGFYSNNHLYVELQGSYSLYRKHYLIYDNLALVEMDAVSLKPNGAIYKKD